MEALAQETRSLGIEHLSNERSIYLGEALLGLGEYEKGRQQLEGAVRQSEGLGLRGLNARGHALLGRALRFLNDSDGAASHYSEALRILEEIRTEAGTDEIMKREDLKAILAESAR